MSLVNRVSRGFSLLEVLIALFILSFGLLGLAQLQIKSFQANQNAYYRSQASLYATDILERMLANQAVAKTGSYQISFDTDVGSSSNSTSMRMFDIIEWRRNIARGLPEGEGEIICVVTPCGSPAIYVVEVRWKKFSSHNLITDEKPYNSIKLSGSL